MIKVIAIIGKSASGKDYLVKSALAMFSKLSPVIHYTTRPKREGEINGVDYHFITEKDLNDLYIISDSVFNNWHYILATDSFNKEKINIGVFNPKELKYLIKEYGDKFQIQVIELLEEDQVRYNRILNRLEKPFDEKGLMEMLRREKADTIDFSEENLKEIKRINLKSKTQYNLGYIGCLLQHMDHSN